MDIRILRYFLTIAREQNITKAARVLHISQPSLSRQIKSLEDELGKTLIIRGKRNISLTDDGILLSKRAEEIITMFDKTQKELSNNSNNIGGEVSIGGNPVMSILTPAARLREKYPDVHYDFFISSATEITERLDNGSIDFAILLKPIDIMKYDYIDLPDLSHWGLIIPRNHPLSEKPYIERDDFIKVPLILHSRPGLQRLIAQWAETDIENLNISAAYNVVNRSPINFVKSGLGCFLTTDDLMPMPYDTDVCFKQLYPVLETHYVMAWKRFAARGKAAEFFFSEVKEYIKNTGKDCS